MKTTYLLSLLFLSVAVFAQQQKIPASYSNIQYDSEGKLYLQDNDTKYFSTNIETKYSIQRLLGKPSATKPGVILDFENLRNR